MGKSTINKSPFSIAMLNYQRVHFSRWLKFTNREIHVDYCRPPGDALRPCQRRWPTQSPGGKWWWLVATCGGRCSHFENGQIRKLNGIYIYTYIYIFIYKHIHIYNLYNPKWDENRRDLRDNGREFHGYFSQWIPVKSGDYLGYGF